MCHTTHRSPEFFVTFLTLNSPTSAMSQPAERLYAAFGGSAAGVITMITSMQLNCRPCTKALFTRPTQALLYIEAAGA